MDWLAPVNAYCERTGPDYWSEPINALTDLSFLIAAGIMWPRVRGMVTGQVLCIMLAVIGVGSWLFHTHANRLTGLMDVLPIVAFILAMCSWPRGISWGSGRGSRGRWRWPSSLTRWS